MENASRALVIAGGVLLSLIIIGVVMFAYRGITSLQKEKDISLSNEQVSKINEQIEKYTKKSVIYGSEVLSICNAIEDYSRKYPESEGYQKITAKIKIKANGKDNDIKECFKDEYDGIQSLKNDYNEAIRKRDVNGKTTISNGKTIEELYNFLGTGGENGDELKSYFELYGLNDLPTITLLLLKRYELYKGYINTFREKRFKASVVYSNTTGIVKEVVIQPK
jgi:hypothetical protein|uniref:NICKEL AND COBALT RESISTANCE PROTEIN BINDING PROTEIN, SENSOR PROTEIN n=1 Tax=Siphoviridae sp. ctES717 TaxID=2827564 RepID=A0A8S5RSL3_9CAUD|nr:MAG TPA: NICKEL AND COBALT RESISTANCE PROTEIN BINDING PROTEIN, SENSOR PROTEIN [Siphoviridae sp. ctES717]